MSKFAYLKEIDTNDGSLWVIKYKEEDTYSIESSSWAGANWDAHYHSLSASQVNELAAALAEVLDCVD